ncbi:MAG: hypothetical protein LBG89_00425, partial [Rickettsiales bacterium]|nr:hypothetical protein [Rickettsiales bacterium]
MKKIISICLIMAGFVGVGAAVEPHMFLPNFEDVPAAAGCVPENSEGFLFSVPEGRIVETIVHCGDNLSRRQFQRFYRDSMK